MKMREKVACMFSSWYETFRDVTTESRVVDLPSDVLDYLMSDGTLVLPSETSTCAIHGQAKHDTDVDTYYDSNDSTNVDWDDTSETLSEPEFKEFSLKVQRCISDLGGAVMPKLNWSAPRDAKWMSFDGTLRCSTLNEILLLLKSSEFITHDLMQPFEGCASPEYIEEVSLAEPLGTTIKVPQSLSGVQFSSASHPFQNVPSGCETDFKINFSHLSGQPKTSISAAATTSSCDVLSVAAKQLSGICIDNADKQSSSSLASDSTCDYHSRQDSHINSNITKSNTQKDYISLNTGPGNVPSTSISYSQTFMSENTQELTRHQTAEVTKGLLPCKESCPPLKYQLTLRRWELIPESEEFRCFVADKHLIAISQRNDSLYFPELSCAMPEISQKIKCFFSHKIQPRFPLSNYVFDVWCRSCDHILLVDFNPFDRVTDSLLFTWEELERLAAKQVMAEKSNLTSVSLPEGTISDGQARDSNHGRTIWDRDSLTAVTRDPAEIEMRCVEAGSAQTCVTTCPMRHYAMPVDLLDLTTGSDMNKFIDLMKLNAGGIQTGGSSDDEDIE